MGSFATIILAAGKGTRMKSKQAKVLHCLCGKPMLCYPVMASAESGSRKTVIVVGFQQQEVKDSLGSYDVHFASQQQQLGSGHAVMCAEPLLKDFKGDILILCGDVPLLRPSTIKNFIAIHQEKTASLTVLAVETENPEGYGRIVRDSNGDLTEIVEHMDATEEQKNIREINTGIYCCDSGFLFTALKKVGNNNAQGEYYLPDIVSIAVKENRKVLAVTADNPIELKGINNRIELADAQRYMQKKILHKHMLNGVTIIDPTSTYIDHDVAVGSDTVIFPGTSIRGNTVIGEGCHVDICCMVSDSTIGNGVKIKSGCVIEESKLSDRATIGPFAHLRPHAQIGKDAKVGNFVEVKKSTIGKGSKASHLTYIGDATIGKDVNIGAGTITCNYDGRNKHVTKIGDGVFVGSNTAIVAPIEIGEKALIGAGSTITMNVPPEALAVTRSKQRNYSNYFRMTQKKDKQ